MFAYEKPVIIRWVKQWDATQPVGVCMRPGEAAAGVRKIRERSYSSPEGYGAQTVRRVLLEHCGWKWAGRSIYKAEDTSAII